MDKNVRVNEGIRAREVRLVGPDGNQVGIKPIEEALAMAEELDLDLVEVAPQAQPPVCKIMDYGKYRYEQTVKMKEARKKQSVVTYKEMKLRPKIDRHDYEIKKKHIERFLKSGYKVKVTIMFRGREMSHTELGRNLLQQIAEELADLGTVETMPKLDGRNMQMIMAPVAVVKKDGGKNAKDEDAQGSGQEV
ncbi:MAG: translation initiation factor IF-3 [Actinomycetota bacterium]|nr:translation initiation factor IF-3 [Actinomycetota bacterium]MDD5665839.1 translation initiation factor IF-3 [Actinomycetota bacterium]